MKPIERVVAAVAILIATLMFFNATLRSMAKTPAEPWLTILLHINAAVAAMLLVYLTLNVKPDNSIVGRINTGIVIVLCLGAVVPSLMLYPYKPVLAIVLPLLSFFNGGIFLLRRYKTN